MSEKSPPKEKSSLSLRFFKWLEKLGNKFPHPLAIFLGLIAIVLILSAVLNAMGVKVKHPTKNEFVAIKSLLDAKGIQYILLNMVGNFSGFAPLGLVLSMILGIGLAEKVGFMASFMKKFILGAPEKLLLFVIMFMGICGNIASDAAVVIIPGIAGAIFYGAKKNPLVGIIAGYAAACAGFTANIVICGTDVLVASLTTESAKIITPGIVVSPVVNYYFMVVSTFVLAITGVWVTSKFVYKIAGDYVPDEGTVESTESYEVSAAENKGLRNAGIAALIYVVLVVAALIPQNSVLRDAKGSILDGPFIKGIVPILLFWFISIGIVYGKTVGTIKTFADIPKLMAKAIAEMSSYIVLVFAMAQFISFFNWSNMGMVLAVSLTDLMKAAHFTGFGMVVAVIFITMFINLFIGSSSAKWALLAPVFVPMFMMLNYTPAFAQLAYRIGDSVTNAITPLSPYFVIVLGYMQKYKKDSGMGNFFALVLPYVVVFSIVWILLLAVFFYFKLPIGPGAAIFM